MCEVRGERTSVVWQMSDLEVETCSLTATSLGFRSKENIKTDFKRVQSKRVDWIQLARDVVQW